MSTLTAPRDSAGRAVFDGWRHGVLVLPALLVVSVLTMFNPFVTGIGFLVLLAGAAMLRPPSLARFAGLAVGLATGFAIAYGALWAMFRNMDF